MKKTILSLFVLSLGLISMDIILSSSSGGRARVARAGNTGAPGESTTCRNCHSGGNFSNTSFKLSLLDAQNNPVTSYVPGATYTLEVGFSTPIGNTAPAGYAFQVVNLVSGTNANYNGWGSAPSTTSVSNAGSRTYFEHTAPITSSVNSISWTAPSAGTGSVTFYGAGNGVNLNRSTSGDFGYLNQLTVTENTTTSLAEINPQEAIRLYPNPVKNTLNIDVFGKFYSQAFILDLSGRQVQSLSINGLDRISADVSDLAEGMYFLRWEAPNGKFYSKKFIKQ